MFNVSNLLLLLLPCTWRVIFVFQNPKRSKKKLSFARNKSSRASLFLYSIDKAMGGQRCSGHTRQGALRTVSKRQEGESQSIHRVNIAAMRSILTKAD